MSAIAVCMGRTLKMGFKLNLPAVVIYSSLVLEDTVGIEGIKFSFVLGVSSIFLIFPLIFLLFYIFFLEYLYKFMTYNFITDFNFVTNTFSFLFTNLLFNGISYLPLHQPQQQQHFLSLDVYKTYF